MRKWWVTILILAITAAFGLGVLNVARAGVDGPGWVGPKTNENAYALTVTGWLQDEQGNPVMGGYVELSRVNEMGWPEIESELFRFGTQMERACFRLADAVYSSSRCSADWCLEHYHARTDDIPVIHTGVDTTRFAPAGPKADRPTVIFVGRLSRNKGVETLVDAVCRLAPEVPRLRLLMLGEGDPALVAQLEHAAAHRPGLLEIRATTGPDDLAEQLCRAHVFAAPSVYEGGPGFVYLEAMACGLPAVGCSGSGVAEVISSGDTGVLVPPQDVDALSDALQTLLHDERRREEMGARARRWVLEHAERAQCLARLESFVGQWCRS